MRLVANWEYQGAKRQPPACGISIELLLRIATTISLDLTPVPLGIHPARFGSR